MEKELQEYEMKLKRVYTQDELLQLLLDKSRIIDTIEVSRIIDSIWPIDYKDTFLVPEEKGKTDYFGALGENGRYLVFRGGGILVNGKNDVPGLKTLGEKEKTCKLLLRRSLINQIFAGETDCLNGPLTPEAIGKFEKERDLIQEGILKAVGPLLDPEGTTIPQSQETAENGIFEDNNGGISLPPEIDRPEARKAFENALKAGFLEKTSTGFYKWQTLPKAAAAYLCEKIYKKPKWGLLGQFLGCSRLDQAAYQTNYYTEKKQKWILKIDALFED